MPASAPDEYRVIAPAPSGGSDREVRRLLLRGDRTVGWASGALRETLAGFFVEVSLHVASPEIPSGPLLDSIEAWGRRIGCLDFRHSPVEVTPPSAEPLPGSRPVRALGD